MRNREDDGAQQSPENYKVEWSQYYIYYTEGDHCIMMGKEWKEDEDCTEIYPDLTKNWEAPHHEERLSEGKKLQILHRIEQQFQRWGKKCKIVYRG